MLIQGNSLDTGMLLETLSKAQAVGDCVDLDVRDVNFECEETSAFVDAIKSKNWKSVKIASCHGLINDVATACMAHNVESFHLQSVVNAQTMFALSFGLKYSRSLLHLSLSIDVDRASSAGLWRALARNVSLQSLKLSGSSVEASAVGHIGFALRLNRTLRSLSLDACYLEDNEMASLLMALQDHPSLKQLSIQQNSCHTEGMAAIACLLNYNDLEELDMSYLVRKKKTPIASTPVTLEQDDLASEEMAGDHNQVEDEDEQGGDSDNIDNDGGAVDEGVQETASTENLEERIDETGEKHAEAPAESDKVANKSLRVLQLAGNGLSDPFIESVLQIFGESSSLEELNLFGNRISDTGLAAIIQKLPELKSLKSLWLGHNLFSIRAAHELVDAVACNLSLQDINIRSMHSDSEWEGVQSTLDYYARLNRAGRQLISASQSSVPLALWPLVLERANRIYWGTTIASGKSASHAADSVYCLLRGPALFENRT